MKPKEVLGMCRGLADHSQAAWLLGFDVFGQKGKQPGYLAMCVHDYYQQHVHNMRTTYKHTLH